MTNEEIVLAIRAGKDVTKNTERLYRKNLGMIRRMAAKFHGLEEEEDLMQEGFLGMMRAIDLWDHGMEVSFLTYSLYWIRQSMLQYIFNCGRLIRIPDYQSNQIYKYRRAKESIYARFGRDARPAEIMAWLEIGPAEYEKLLRDLKMVNVRSMSEPITSDDGDEITLEDTLQDTEAPIDDLIDRIQGEELAREIWSQVGKLPKDEQAVICGKYLHGQTYSQCGESMGIPSENVKSLYEKAMRTLRRPKVTRRLEPYLTEGTAYSMGLKSGYMRFRNSGASAQERAVMKLENKTGPIWKGCAAEWPIR